LGQPHGVAHTAHSPGDGEMKEGDADPSSPVTYARTTGRPPGFLVSADRERRRPPTRRAACPMALLPAGLDEPPKAGLDVDDAAALDGDEHEVRVRTRAPRLEMTRRFSMPVANYVVVFDRFSSSLTSTTWSHSGHAPPSPRLRPNRLQSGQRRSPR